LTFGIHANIQAASDDRGISKMNFNFVKIKAIQDLEPNSTCDIIAIVRGASEVSTITLTKQAGKLLEKRELTLVDDSLSEVIHACIHTYIHIYIHTYSI
jgi:replication factor A1